MCGCHAQTCLGVLLSLLLSCDIPVDSVRFISSIIGSHVIPKRSEQFPFPAFAGNLIATRQVSHVFIKMGPQHCLITHKSEYNFTLYLTLPSVPVIFIQVNIYSCTRNRERALQTGGNIHRDHHEDERSTVSMSTSV